MFFKSYTFDIVNIYFMNLGHSLQNKSNMDYILTFWEHMIV